MELLGQRLYIATAINRYCQTDYRKLISFTLTLVEYECLFTISPQPLERKFLKIQDFKCHSRIASRITGLLAANYKLKNSFPKEEETREV